MAITNQQRVGKGLDLLRECVAEFVQREFRSKYGTGTLPEAQCFLATDWLRSDKSIVEKAKNITKRAGVTPIIAIIASAGWPGSSGI